MKRVLPLLAVVLLSGCFGPPTAPDHAETDRDPDLPGLKLSTWTDERAGRWRIHALVVNDSDQTYNYRVGCGHPWNVTLSGPAGHVEFREVQEEPGCAAQWEVLRPQGHIDTLYSWDFEDHDPEAGTSEPVPNGTYVWRIEFHLRDQDVVLATEHVRDVTLD